MSYILLLVINLIIIFIAWVILYSKIKKNSIPSRVEEYTREVERLIVELNRALEDVVSISEERIDELKALIKKAEKIVYRSSKNMDKVKTIKSTGDSEIDFKDNRKKQNGIKNNGPEKILVNNKTSEQKDTRTESRKGEKRTQLNVEGGALKGSLIEKTQHLIGMGYSRDEIAQILGITPVEVEFLKSLSVRKT